MSRRGQSLVELAIVLPLLVMLALGVTQLVRLALARAGLDAATAAAAAAAARATSASTASAAGRRAFDAVAGGYGLDQATTVSIDTGAFARGSSVVASGSTPVALGPSGVPALGLHWLLTSIASARVEDWRSRPPGP